MKNLILLFLLLIFYGNSKAQVTNLFSNLNASYPVFIAQNTGTWENPATWGGTVPTHNAAVRIPTGLEVTITTNLPTRHKFIQVEGDLYMSISAKTKLKVETLFVTDSGYFRIGLPNFRVDQDKRAEIEFISDAAPIDLTWDPNQLSRGLLSMGKIDIYGAIKTHVLAFKQDIPAGSSSITLTEPIPVDWEIGDQLVLPGTKFVRDDKFEDEVLKISSISGQTISFSTSTKHHHRRVDSQQNLHLANLTRNVILKSESTDKANQRRAHIMFMANDVDMEHVAVIDLGRTDKTIPLDELTVDTTTGAIGVGLSKNVRGRYGIHFHKNGYGSDVNDPPSNIIGCVVRNTQGWGFVNHSSHVHFEQNVCYDFAGAAFVTESGDELGNFDNNIAIKGTGNGEYRTIQLVFSNEERPSPLADFGFSGEGFWFQGPAVRVTNNVAANSNGSGMVWFTVGAIEIIDNQMIGMDESTILSAYSGFPNIGAINPRHWNHAPNEVFLGDFPILECDGFEAYGCLAGLYFRFNNGPVSSFFNSDFGQTDIFGYYNTIQPAAGYTSLNRSDRITQFLSNLSFWNNEIGLRARYSSKTDFTNVNVTNNLRYGNNINYFPGITSFHNIFDYTYNNTNVENYGIGIKVFSDSTDITDPQVTLNGDNYENVANENYDLIGEYCSEVFNIFSKSISSTSNEIRFSTNLSTLNTVVRYKSENDDYWQYESEVGGNSVLLTNLTPSTAYTYQVIAGCETNPSLWSQAFKFITSCQNINCGYAIGGTWSYGDNCVAPVCIGDNIRLRLQTTDGSSVWTKPDGTTVNGNGNNAISLNPIEIDEFGVYEVVHMSSAGCLNYKTIEVVPQLNEDGGYAIGPIWTYGTFIAPVCIGEDVRLRLNTTSGSSVWTKPDGTTVNGNSNNAIFLYNFEAEEYGIYYCDYTDASGCNVIYEFETTPKNDVDLEYIAGSTRLDVMDGKAYVPLNSNFRIRVVSTTGTSVWTKPDGTILNGNAANIISINPFTILDYGIYTVDYTDANQICPIRKTIEVLPPLGLLSPGNGNSAKDKGPNFEDYLIYPNPSLNGEEVFLKGNNINSVKIVDMQGRLVKETTYAASQELVTLTTINLKGVYVIIINNKYIHKLVLLN